MNAMELRAKKMEIIEMLMNMDDENTVSQIFSVVRKAKDIPNTGIPNIPNTPEQLRKAVSRSEEQYAQGRIVTVENLRAKHPRVR